jgi:hypothetical protein
VRVGGVSRMVMPSHVVMPAMVVVC